MLSYFLSKDAKLVLLTYKLKVVKVRHLKSHMVKLL